MDEKKTYSVVGTVTIGADEYRDLIESLKEAEHEATTNRSAKWELQSVVEKLKVELKEVQEKLVELDAFVKSDEAVSTKFKLWRIEQQG